MPNYNVDPACFIWPCGKKSQPFQPKNGSPTEYIGTVVFREDGSDVNAGKLDVYHIDDWKFAGIKQLRQGESFFTDALNSPDNFGAAIYDTDTIRVFARKGYYFVDEKTGQKSLRHFNIRWAKPEILRYYPGCAYICSDERH